MGVGWWMDRSKIDDYTRTDEWSWRRRLKRGIRRRRAEKAVSCMIHDLLMTL